MESYSRDGSFRPATGAQAAAVRTAFIDGRKMVSSPSSGRNEQII